MPPKPSNMSWESFSEYLVRRAMHEGEFNNLPGTGKPIPSLDEPYHQDWWLRATLKRESLSVPCPSLEIRRDVETTLHRIQTLRNETKVRQELTSLNDRIIKVNRHTTTGPSTTGQLHVSAG